MSIRRSMRIATRVAIAPLAILLACGAARTTLQETPSDRQAASGPEPGWREPVALAASGDGRWLYVANREAGSISVVDLDRAEVAAEVVVGRAPAALASTPDGRFLLAADEQDHRAVLLAVDGPRVEPVGRVEVASSPVGVAIDPDGTRAFVASLWSRSVTLLALDRDDGGAGLRDLGRVPLPFEARGVLAIGGHRAVVADAFGGRLAVVDGDSGSIVSLHELPAHNIRGLALSEDGERVQIAHQEINRSARTDMNDIHWAGFIASLLRSVPLATLLDPGADPLAGASRLHLSDVGDGAGDPNGILVMPGGRLAVALGGVDRVAFGVEGRSIGHRIAVGRRPVAMARVPGSDRVAVANAFDDSVSIVTLQKGAKAVSVPLGPTPEADDERLGRMRFYDARLSHDGWMSCHSCHTDGHSNGLLVDTLGDDSYGTPKRTLSLLGVGETGPWAWDGGMDALGDQIKKSVVSTMRGYPLYEDESRQIEAYLRSLPPAPALVPAGHPEHDAGAVARGSALFRSMRCDRCHEPPLYTTPKAYDVGLADERGQAEFNPPSLRGVGRRPVLFHDGGAGSLEAVFSEHEHQLEEPLGPEDLADLIAFLKSL